MPNPHQDLLDINNLLAEYCLASDDGRYEDWARCFAADGEVHAFRRTWKGHDALVEFISSAPGGLHMCGIPHVSLHGDRAGSVVNFVFVTEEKAIGSMGKYVDTLVRAAEGWRIESRQIRILKPRAS